MLETQSSKQETLYPYPVCGGPVEFPLSGTLGATPGRGVGGEGGGGGGGVGSGQDGEGSQGRKVSTDFG